MCNTSSSLVPPTKQTKNIMKTKIFAYKNAIGATTDLDNGIFLNNPKAMLEILMSN